MGVKWTPSQRAAIEARDGTLLVSAAAGSGKTAVLVERVVQRITDERKKIGIDELLIVTFTRAAASQMRERISDVIDKRLRENPHDKHLRRQKFLLPFAKICTIDSFCNDLVRENFHKLGIDMDYSLLDSAQSDIISNEAMSIALENLYGRDDEAAKRLLDLFAYDGRDKFLAKTISSLYKNSVAFPFPEEWLENLVLNFQQTDFLEESLWGKIIIEHCIRALEYASGLSCRSIELLRRNEQIEKSYGAALSSDESMINNLRILLETANWDSIKQAVDAIKFENLKALKAEFKNSDYEQIINNRNEIKTVLKKLPELFPVTVGEHNGDMEYMLPGIKALIQTVSEYADALRSCKERQNSLDFYDVIHLALGLLIEKKDGEIVKTDIARSISDGFTEILVDEFQDINETQNMLFWAISKDEQNLFMVGDVKQSIYRFRQAMPGIFISRRDELDFYKDGNHPSKIVLERNFRSRKSVTDAVNFLFTRLMSRETGDIDYDENERLVCAANYPEKEDDFTELHILDTADSEKNRLEAEAQYIAGLIHSMVSQSERVTENGVTRPVTYRDFCILVRSAKDKTSVYVNALTRQGIPVYSEQDGGFFAAQEIHTMLSIMKVIDNPIDDVSLLCVMLSPIYGFTPDDLAKMRVKERKGNIYQLINYHAANGDKRCEYILDDLAEMRMICSGLTVGEMINYILEHTGFSAVVCAMDMGEQRLSNLNLFISYAAKYETLGNSGLSGFIRFISKMEDAGVDLSASNEVSQSADVVRIMSIHKSKGLEFPICIIANCSGKFNDMEINSKCVIHPAAGIGLRLQNTENLISYDTLSLKAVRTLELSSSRGEELRVLYTALTRAKEKLILVMSINDIHKKIKKLSPGIMPDGTVSPFKVNSLFSYTDWILSAAISSKNCRELNEMSHYSGELSDKSSIKMIFAKACDDAEDETVEEKQIFEPDPDLIREIRERISYKYPYSHLSGISGKCTPSSFVHERSDYEYFASTKPKFAQSGDFTPAMSGTAVHLFMQYADAQMAAIDTDKEIDRLRLSGVLDADQAKAVKSFDLQKFYTGELYSRIKNADNVYNEYEVKALVSADKIYEDLPAYARDEKLVIQGCVDCVITENGEAVIIDYKTDRARSAQELYEKYKAQLKLYAYAVEEVLNLPVKELVLYSIRLNSMYGEKI